MEDPWRLVRTQPRRELYAQENLKRWRGCITYLPMIKTLDRIQMLFPSYLFVKTEPWWFLKNTWGVSSVIMAGNNAATVPNRAIDELKAREGKDGYIELPKFRYRIGQRLKVESGPFENWIGLYDGMDNHERIRVLLDLMGRKVPVTVERVSMA